MVHAGGRPEMDVTESEKSYRLHVYLTNFQPADPEHIKYLNHVLKPNLVRFMYMLEIMMMVKLREI